MKNNDGKASPDVKEVGTLCNTFAGSIKFRMRVHLQKTKITSMNIKFLIS